MSTAEISLEQIAARKDETVRILEQRSLSLLAFTYTHNPERAADINRTLEHDMNLILLNAHKKLAHLRLYGDASAKYELKQCEKLVEEAEDCYERFQTAQRLNPNPTTTAIVHIFGIDDLSVRARQSQSDLESVNKAYTTILESCKGLLDNCQHIRRMIRSLKEQSRLIFYKQAQVASLIDEVAIFKGLCVTDKVAEDLHSACLSQAASEFNADVWASKIKECCDTLEACKRDAQSFYNARESALGKDAAVMPKEQAEGFQEQISKNTASILQLSRELVNLEIPDCIKLELVNPDDIMRIKFVITPEEGIYKDIPISFLCRVTDSYPHERPRVTCESKILHPNVLGANAKKCAGAVCLNVIREAWRPIFTLETVAMGLLNLLLQPSPIDPLDHKAALLYTQDPDRLRELNLALAK